MSDASCPICLDDLKTPVSTPCGHIHCEDCLFSHFELNSDAFTGSCPSCRAEFPIATPELRFVPSKYHKFIQPSVRRVFLDAPTQSAKALKIIVTRLEARVDGLQRDKMLLMERCEAAMAASAKHAEGERDARLENEKFRKEIHELRKKYDGLKKRYKERNSRDDSGQSQAVKRKSSLAALDSSSSSSSSSGFTQSPESEEKHDNFDRPILRIPKRPRLLGSPFDFSKSFSTGAMPRPALFKKRGAPVLLSVGELSPRKVIGRPWEDDDETTVGSSGGPQRSGLPTGDVFSPEVARDSDCSRGSIDYRMGECDHEDE